MLRPGQLNFHLSWGILKLCITFYIFYMRPTLCDTFRSRALWTWDMLDKGRSINCQIGEETLTDLNILELKIRHSTEICSITFNKIDEGTNGADWEWWFTNSSANKWIGFRVQAKVIDIKKQCFEHLYYKNSKNSLHQCDILINDSLAKTHPRIPLYCLYSNWSNSTELPLEYENYYSLREIYGCSILPALAVRYLRCKNKKPKHLKHLFQYMRPWHYLVSYGKDKSSELPQRVYDYWVNFIRPIENFVIEELDDNILLELNEWRNKYLEKYNKICLVDKPPQEVIQLMNNELVDRPDPNLRTLTVFKERDRVCEQLDEFISNL
ncbi:DUF6615 family protein [Nostoc sp.]